MESTRGLHVHVQLDGIDVEAIGPGRNAHLQEYTGEEGGILQRSNHRAALREEVAEVMLAGSPIGEADPQAIAADGLDLYDFYDDKRHTSAPGTCSNGSFCRPRSQF